MSRSGLMPWSLLPLLFASILGWTSYDSSPIGPPTEVENIGGIEADRYALWHSPALDGSSASLDRETEAFQALDLRVIGTNFFSDGSLALLSSQGMSEAMMYEIGDVIGGFSLESIQPGSLIFSRGGYSHTLNLGGGATKTMMIAEAASSASSRIIRKRSQNDLKSSFEIGDIIFDPVIGSYAYGDIIPEFMMPIAGRISSPFGKRTAPKAGARSRHMGIDIAAPYRTPVLATASGIISKVYRTAESGISIEITHGGDFKSYYFHLAKALVRDGETVDQGMIIGQEGTTGVSTGPHLHFEIHRKGREIDPLSIINLAEGLLPNNL